MSILITYNNSINSKNIPNIMIIMKIVYNINWNLTFADRMYVFFFWFLRLSFLVQIDNTYNQFNFNAVFVHLKIKYEIIVRMNIYISVLIRCDYCLFFFF